MPCARAAPALPDSDAAGLTGMRPEERVHSKLEPSRTGGFLHFLAKWTNIPCPVPIVFELADSPLSARSRARSGGWFRQLLTRREHLRSRFKILGHDCSQRESPSGADRLPPTGPADEGRGWARFRRRPLPTSRPAERSSPGLRTRLLPGRRSDPVPSTSDRTRREHLRTRSELI